MEKHKWIAYEDGKTDIFAYTEGEYHNGPKCSVCGFGFCHHCHPEGYETSCPCDSMASDDSKLWPQPNHSLRGRYREDERIK